MMSKERYDDWPTSKVNHSAPISFEKFCTLANDIQLLLHKHTMLNIELPNKTGSLLKKLVLLRQVLSLNPLLNREVNYFYGRPL